MLSLLGFLLDNFFCFVFDLMQSIPNVNQNVQTRKSCLLISINEIINVNSYKGTVDSFTFHGTFCFHPLNKLSHHITRPNITFLKSRSTYILIYKSMCAVECVRSQTITSIPTCRMRYRQSTSTNTSHFCQHIL